MSTEPTNVPHSTENKNLISGQTTTTSSSNLGSTTEHSNVSGLDGGGTNNNKQKDPRFKGNPSALKGHVFELSAGATQYPKTLEQLHLYSVVTCKDTPEISILFGGQPTMLVVQLPGDIPTGTGKNRNTLYDTKTA